jgi:cytochrome c oxidase subunit III
VSSATGLAHQFETPEQQFEAAHLGIWIFLITEILFFGGVFCAYVIYRTTYGEAWAAGSRLNDADLGAGMTAVLLLSSLMMALAVHYAQLGTGRLVQAYLVATMLLGVAFLAMKGFEYHRHWAEHLVPGINFSGYEGPHPGQVELFICFYFILTAIHAVHMVIGIGLLTVIWFMVKRGRFSSSYYTPVEVAGLYWHFVDIVWIFLFPLLYLVDLHK